MEKDNIIFEIKKLNFFYGSNHILKDIECGIQKNKVTAIVGPSGCGKTTFLRTLNRMSDLAPTAKYTGRILLDGENILDQDPIKVREKVGMVFQQPNPFPKSIRNNITYGPKLHGEKNKRILDEIVESSLKQAALWDEVKNDLKKSGMALSGGQQQRLCIARALSVKPEALLLDEPTSALDPIATSKIEELVEELSKNYTIIIVTHNLQQALRISDYMMFFYLGELVEFDLTEQMATNPADKRTNDYLRGIFS